MHLVELFESTIAALMQLINQIGYLGIFIGMFLESTLIPIPSELVMIPAGMSAFYGEMNLYLVILVGVAGNVAGAVFSYYLALYLGRAVLLKIGRYFFIKPNTIIKIENFFNRHGNISVFTGRLIPGVRHFISIPAGVARMNIKTFYFYTTLGSTIWTIVLVSLGFNIGAHKDLIAQYLHIIILACIITCTVIILIYGIIHKKTKQ